MCQNLIISNYPHAGSQSTSEEAAKDVAAFVSIFFENFHKFAGRAFHMAGESYGVSPVSLHRLLLLRRLLGTIHPGFRGSRL